MPNDFSIVMFDVNESVLYIHCIKVTYSVKETVNHVSLSDFIFFHSFH